MTLYFLKYKNLLFHIKQGIAEQQRTHKSLDFADDNEQTSILLLFIIQMLLIFNCREKKTVFDKIHNTKRYLKRSRNCCQ